MRKKKNETKTEPPNVKKDNQTKGKNEQETFRKERDNERENWTPERLEKKIDNQRKLNHRTLRKKERKRKLKHRLLWKRQLRRTLKHRTLKKMGRKYLKKRMVQKHGQQIEDLNISPGTSGVHWTRYIIEPRPFSLLVPSSRASELWIHVLSSKSSLNFYWQS